jgi:arylsulfatase
MRALKMTTRNALRSRGDRSKAVCLVFAACCTWLACGDSDVSDVSTSCEAAPSQQQAAASPHATNTTPSRIPTTEKPVDPVATSTPARRVALASGEEQPAPLALGSATPPHRLTFIDASASPRYIRLGTESRESTPLAPGVELQAHVTPRPSGRLEIAIGMPANSSDPEKKPQYGIFIVERIDGGAREVLVKQRIGPRRHERRTHWVEVQADLSRFAGQKITLAFHFKSSKKSIPLELTLPWISYPRLAGERNVILVSLDTLRADRLNAYGYERHITSPNLDALANKGARFEAAYSNSPWTTPSHMSLFTSLYPSAHGFDAPIRKVLKQQLPFLDASVPTLPEFLRDAGFINAAITGGATITGRYGFERGFHAYADLIIKEGAHLQEEVAASKAWITRHRDRRFFFFLHTFEIHTPYMNRGYANEVEGAGGSDREVMNARYSGDLFYTDGLMGGFFDFLKEQGLYDESIIVIFSDHGENLHDRFLDSDRPYGKGHGYQLHEEMLHVPLIIVAPGLIAPGRVIEAQVESIDILPTLLSLLGIDAGGAEFQGRDLSPSLLGGTPLEEAPIFASATIYGPERKSVRTQDMKYVWIEDRGPDPDREIPFQGYVWDWSDLPEHELFDLQNDPLEANNLAEGQPESVERLNRLVSEQEARNQSLRKQLDTSGKAASEELDVEALRALGYVE